MAPRSVLGTPRVTKRRSAAASWASSLPRTKAGGASRRVKTLRERYAETEDDQDSSPYESGPDHGRFDGLLGPTRLFRSPSSLQQQQQQTPTPPPQPQPQPSGTAHSSTATASTSEAPMTSVAKAHRHGRSTMFEPIPQRAAGMSSTRVADVLAFRAALPPVTTAAHVAALLLLSSSSSSSSSPAVAEREMARRVAAGEFRKVILPRRGVWKDVRGPAAGFWSGEGIGGRGRGSSQLSSGNLGDAVEGRIAELLVRREDYEAMVRRECVTTATAAEDDERQRPPTSLRLCEKDADEFLAWCRANPAAIEVRGDEVPAARADALVRAGFLTANHGPRGSMDPGLYSRPEHRHTLVSLETVARAAAGSIEAVGGAGAMIETGGTGAGRARSSSSAGGGFGNVTAGSRRRTAAPGPLSPSSSFSHDTLRVAVPDAGPYLKLVSGALAHLARLLREAPWRELPEADLRERWDGGVAGDRAAALAKRARGEFAGVLPGRTRKWTAFYGLRFEWVLCEAVGAGLVELFQTGSVGRAVRLQT